VGGEGSRFETLSIGKNNSQNSKGDDPLGNQVLEGATSWEVTVGVKEWEMQLVSHWEKCILELSEVCYLHWWTDPAIHITLEKHGSLSGSREPKHVEWAYLLQRLH